MRFVFGVALVLSVGIGAFFGSAQVAGSTKVPPKTVTMRIGDVAVVGPVECLAWTDSRRFPIRRAYMRCSARPKDQAPYWSTLARRTSRFGRREPPNLFTRLRDSPGVAD
jgi:hypothetical protein